MALLLFPVKIFKCIESDVTNCTYLYIYTSFILTYLLLIQLNTNYAIINLGLSFLIKCVLILLLSYRLIIMYHI